MPVFPGGLVGRAHERSVIGRALDLATQGTGSVIVLEAAPGLGKSALSQWCGAEAADRGIAVIAARADPLWEGTPFAVAAQLLPGLSWSTDGDAPIDPAAAGTTAGALFSTVERARELLEQRALVPLLIVVDDLQWADPASIQVLSAAAGLASTLPLVLVVTTRTPAAPDRVEPLARSFERPLTHIDIAPLSAAETADLALSLLGAEPGPRLEDLIAGAAGNPLLLIELVRGLEADGALATAGGVVETEQTGLTPSLRADVNRRLRALGEDVLAAVRGVTVAGPVADVGTVAALLDQTTEWATRNLELALAAGVLVAEGSRVALRHDLLRDAVYLETPSPTRAALHRRMAEVLNGYGNEPAVVAAHLALGASPGDEAAVAWLTAAADTLQQAAPTSALALVDRALELVGDDPAGTRALQRARLDLLMQLGRLDEAATLAKVLVRWLGPELSATEQAALYGRAAGLLIVQRQADEGLALLDEGIDTVGDEAAQARLIAQRSLAKMTVADYEGARADAEAAVRGTEACGDAVGSSIALAVAGRIGTYWHDYRQGLEPGLQAVLVAEQEPTGEAHLHLPCFYYALSGIDVDDMALTTRAIERGRSAAERLGHAYAFPLYCGAAASVHYRRGELDDAWAEASAGLSFARDTGSHQASMWCEAFRALVALHRGELEAARTHAAAAEAAWAEHSAPLGVDFMALAVAGVADAAGDREKAFEVLDGAWDAFGAMGVRSCQPLLGADLVRVALATGRTRRAETIAAGLTDAAATSGLEGHRALAAHAVGLVEGDVALLRDAVARHDATGRRLEAAVCSADAARVAHRANHADSDSLGREAIERLEAVGADGTLERLQRELGGKSSSGGGRFGWDSLTPTELAIVELVVGGLTNAQIASERGVSRRTVESHLVRVYTKIGISSRVQLAVAAADRGIA